MQRDWHKLRVGCSSPCHKRPGTASSAFFSEKGKKKTFLVDSWQHGECHHLHGLDTPMSRFFVPSPTCFLCAPPSLSSFLPTSLPLFISVISLLSSLLPFFRATPPFSVDGGGAIHANYGSSSRWLLAGGKRINPCKDFTSLGNPFNVAS